MLHAYTHYYPPVGLGVRHNMPLPSSSGNILVGLEGKTEMVTGKTTIECTKMAEGIHEIIMLLDEGTRRHIHGGQCWCQGVREDVFERGLEHGQAWKFHVSGRPSIVLEL